VLRAIPNICAARQHPPADGLAQQHQSWADRLPDSLRHDDPTDGDQGLYAIVSAAWPSGTGGATV
jgi:hypothetical protein